MSYPAGSLEVQMFANLARLAQDMRKASNLVSKTVLQINSALNTIGVGLSFVGITSLINGSINALDRLHDLSLITNLTVEDLSGLSLVAKQSGTDIDGLAKSVNFLAKSMGKAPEEFKKLQDKLAKTRREAKNLRIANRKLRDGEDAPDEKTVEERKHAAELNKWQERSIRSGAKAALVQKGADPEFIDLLVGKIKSAEIDFDDDDEPVFDDWLEEMEEKYPKAFTPSSPRRRTPSVDQAAAATKPTKRQPSYGEQVIAQGYGIYGQRAPRRRS